MEKREVELNYEERSKIAEENFKRFIGLLEYVTTEKKIIFDLVISAGDSGISMEKFVEIYYEKTKKEKPLFLSLPIYRFKEKGKWAAETEEDKFDNSMLLPIVRESFDHIEKIENVLFVDDEIGYGTSVKACLDLLLKAEKEKITKPLHFFIMAENHWFTWEYKVSDVEVHFYTIGKKIMGYNNTITELVPWEFQNMFPEVNGKKSRKVMINTLLDLPTKKMEDGVPKFTFDETDRISKGFPDVKKWQGVFKKKIERLLDEGITDYKNNKTDLMLEYSF